jgi:hypothetical protein
MDLAFGLDLGPVFFGKIEIILGQGVLGIVTAAGAIGSGPTVIIKLQNQTTL